MVAVVGLGEQRREAAVGGTADLHSLANCLHTGWPTHFDTW